MKTLSDAIAVLSNLYRDATVEYNLLSTARREAGYTGQSHYAQFLRIRMKEVQAQRDILLTALCDICDTDPETMIESL